MKTNTMPKTPTLKIERLFNATPEKLWSFWTDGKKFAKWFNPSPGLDLIIQEHDARPGGRSKFIMPLPDGKQNQEDGVFYSLDLYRQIVSGSPDKSFLIKVNFVPVGKQTRMTVEVTGVPAEYHQMATVGWNQGFDKLEKQLATSGKPAAKPVGFTIERTFKAPPQKIWDMWTNGRNLERWFTGQGYTSKVTKLEPRVGGEYVIELTNADGTLRNHGRYVEFNPPRRLAIIWKFDIFLKPGEKPYDVPITVDFEAVPGGTKMTFTEGPLATPEFTEGSRQGVMANFDRLAKLLGV